ncbi:hypothetical protein FAGAP_2537 [Fusarium agapanthi]|uniref:Uncharacterized protein n=1 Tax=Fusarium agapanthi TaxID=1803897 RepID=A0A9P5BFF6_9HYPO|nr:hypothetical protein FAGAP_2537 [Fusarium agapanthi]
MLSWSFESMGLGNVKCFKLIDTFVSPRSLKKILDSCSQLESFMLIAKKSYCLKFRVGDIAPQTLPQFLSVRQETLRYVELYWRPRPINDNVMDIVGSFKGLATLETLILGGPGFRFEKAENKKTFKACLVNLLPQSSRSVTIDSESMSLHEPVYALAEAVKQGSFPTLKEVRCYNWGEGDLTELVLKKISVGGSSTTRQEIGDWLERNKSSRILLSRLSRTCNVSFSAESKGLLNGKEVRTRSRLWLIHW